MKTFKYIVHEHFEPAAGINFYGDEVSITVISGDPGGEPGEFEEHMRQALAEWYDQAGVDWMATEMSVVDRS